MHLLGVDTGGTFTDFVYYDGSRLMVHKVLSTPQAPEQAILQGIQEMQLPLDQVAIIHGSTVATNAVLQRRGVKTVYITNRGFADVLSIGRQARRELYNLQPAPAAVPVEPEYCLETGGRISAQGEVLEPLTAQDLEQLTAKIKQLKPGAVAINLLFSWLNDNAEKQIQQHLKEVFDQELFISRSSEVLAEYKEYERGMATWLNAWIGPLVQQYLQRLRSKVQPASVSVMQSSGGTVGIEQAGRHAVQMLLSGPAGGLAGARYVAACDGIERLMTFDMGGTSSDVALIDVQISLTTQGHISDWPVAVPMVDMHTIGAGGGSIARVDQGGLLQVGPESAGSMPGPACYGNGSTLATVTDANLVLGRILPDAFLGGHMSLDVKAAHDAIQQIAEQMQTDVPTVAEGIVRIANEHMSAALRVISVQRGLDPRQFTLVSFGGAGGLHVCALAESLQMTSALIPVYSGVLSAMGMMVAPRSRLLSQTVNYFIQNGEQDMSQLSEVYQRLSEQASAELTDEGIAGSDQTVEWFTDLRYRGQSSTLPLAWNENAEQLCQQFHLAHEQRFGHRLSELVEVVNLRVKVQGPQANVVMNHGQQSFVNDFTTRDQEYPAASQQQQQMERKMQVLRRDQLSPGQLVYGPCLIIEPVATTYISEGWQCSCQQSGNLLLEHKSGKIG